MSANIEALVVKHCNDLFNPDVTGAQVIRNALTEQAETHAIELRAYEATVAELTRRVEAQSVPVVGDVPTAEQVGEEIGMHSSAWDCVEPDKIVAAVIKLSKPTHSITAAELATLREKAAEADELRKDAERPDCGTCANRGRVNGLSQETFCEHCSWSEKWRKNHYKPIATQERQP